MPFTLNLPVSPISPMEIEAAEAAKTAAKLELSPVVATLVTAEVRLGVNKYTPATSETIAFLTRAAMKRYVKFTKNKDGEEAFVERVEPVKMRPAIITRHHRGGGTQRHGMFALYGNYAFVAIPDAEGKLLHSQSFATDCIVVGDENGVITFVSRPNKYSVVFTD